MLYYIGLLLCGVSYLIAVNPIITSYKYARLTPDAPCFMHVFHFKSTSGKTNSTFRIIQYSAQFNWTTQCNIVKERQHICALVDNDFVLNIGEQHLFRVVEKTVKGKDLVSPDFYALIEPGKTVNQPLKYAHAVYIRDHVNLVHLSWIEEIPPKQCTDDAMRYKNRNYYYRQGESKLETINKKKIILKKLKDVAGMERWTRCSTTVRRLNNLTNTFTVMYGLMRIYYAPEVKLAEFNKIMPVLNCSLNENDKILLQWKKPISNFSTSEILTLPYTYYKLTTKTHKKSSEEGKALTNTAKLPLNLSHYKMNYSTKLTYQFSLDGCFGDDGTETCSKQTHHCIVGGYEPKVVPSTNNDGDGRITDWIALLLLPCAVGAFLLVYIQINKRYSCVRINENYSTIMNIIQPRKRFEERTSSSVTHIYASGVILPNIAKDVNLPNIARDTPSEDEIVEPRKP